MTAEVGVAHRGSSGQVVPGMLDAWDRVTGRVPYTINVALPGMLHARLLRSESAHARLLRVDASRARALPGVAAVLTGQDILDRGDIQPRFGPVLRDQPILAYGKVRFVGEPLAAVAAADPDVAARALELIDVEYADLPPVFSLDEALADGAALVHEEPPHPGPTFADIILHTGSGTNLCNHFKLRKGDVEAGFAEAVHVFEDVFTSPAVQHVPLETHACVASWTDAGITIHAATQIPYVLRSQLAEVFRLPASKVRVIVSTLGGGYGAKCYPNIEPIAVALSRLARRPVRLVLSREEEFVTITKHAVRVRMKTGLRADGTICARKVTAHFNTGAYADIGPRLIKNGGYGTGGPTHIPNVWIDSYAVYTNLPPAGAFRGYGITQAAWAYETQMDMIAARISADPYELRMKNLLTNGQTFATGETLNDCHFQELLTAVRDRIGWDPLAAPAAVAGSNGTKVRAKGLSCIIKGTVTPSTSTAAAKLNDDGSLDVSTSAVEMGQGLHTAMAILAAEQLDLPVDRVHVSFVDTDVTPYDQQTSSSRSTQAMGHAVAEATVEIRGQLLQLAAQLLEADVTDLELRDGSVQVRGVPARALGIGDVLRRTRAGSLLGRGRFQSSGGLDPETGQGNATVHWHQAAGAAEVEVDLETGKVGVVRYEAALYTGRSVNPVQVDLQSEGNVAFGIGQALYEEMLYDNGQLQNGNLGDYMIASMKDMPADLGLSALENKDTNEIHGIGETGLPPVMPAIGNAVFRATGVRIVDLPITAEKVLRGLRELRGESNDGGDAEAGEDPQPADALVGAR